MFVYVRQSFSSVTCLSYAGVNVLCGVGILSTPYAVKQGGWLGLVIPVVLGALAWYTDIVLRRCLESKDGLETYPDIGHAAFGTAGRIIISVSIFHTSNAHLLFSFCILYTMQCNGGWFCANSSAFLRLLQPADNPVYGTICKYIRSTIWFRSLLAQCTSLFALKH